LYHKILEVGMPTFIIQDQAVVPPVSEDYTDKDGNAAVNEYTVTVEDTEVKIENAFITIADGKISVMLPDGHTLTTSNQTTVTVTKDNAPVEDMSVTVTDSNDKTATKDTDSNGKITVPVRTTGGSSGGSLGGSGGGGGGGTVSSTYNVTVTDKDGKTVSVTKSIKNNDITLTLPSGTELDGSNYYTITVTDRQGEAAENIDVTLKDRDGNEEVGVTDENGQVILPNIAVTHRAYIIGYEDGTFRPEGNITRAEAAAIFARNIAELKDESISGRTTSFDDVESGMWYTSYIAYLEKYDIINGYEDGTFRPDAEITRAEFVAMAERAYSLFADVENGKNNIFTDIDNSHWAAEHIYTAIAMDWIKGYADGTFRPDNHITRAEVVTIVNRVTERNADEDFIDENISDLLNFSDVKDKGYWAYYDIAEAANTHDALIFDEIESWAE
ncbi:MAG: S-layer homology domain-containing protein, partial [Monoglobales bacterium]